MKISVYFNISHDDNLKSLWNILIIKKI